MRALGLASLVAITGVIALGGCKAVPAALDEPDPGLPAPSEAATSSAGEDPIVGQQGLRDIVPSQRWPDLPPRVIGLLYQRGQQAWGEALHHSGAFESLRDRDRRSEYAFSVNDSSPYALYFLSPDGAGVHHIRNWQVETPEGRAFFDAGTFDASTPNNWGLNEPAHFVELEVNEGRGGRRLHFVATDVRVLDGQAGLPANPTRSLIDVRKHFDPLVDEHRRELREVFAASSKQAKARADDYADAVRANMDKASVETARQDERVGLAPTWRAEAGELAVIFVYQHVGTVTVHIQRPKSTGGIYYGPTHSETEFGYGVRFGARYVVRGAGEVTVEEVLKVEDVSWESGGGF